MVCPLTRAKRAAFWRPLATYRRWLLRRRRAARGRPGSEISGGGGIRTHERLATPTVFETAPFNRSGTPPGNSVGADFTAGRRWRAAGEAQGLKNRCVRRCKARAKRRADPTWAVLRPPSAAAALAGDRGAALGRRLPDLADRLERRRGEPGRLRDAAGDRDLRALGAGDAGLVLLVAAARGATGGDAGALGRRLRLHLRRADRGGVGDPGRLPRAHLPAHDLPARRRAAAGDGGAGRAGRRPLHDPARQLPRQGGQHQCGAGAHRGRAGADARRRPRADARRARRDGRLLRRRAHGPGAEPARLLQPRLGPALRRRPPRAVALLPRRLPRQGPPRRRLLVRLGGADPARRR